MEHTKPSNNTMWKTNESRRVRNRSGSLSLSYNYSVHPAPPSLLFHSTKQSLKKASFQIATSFFFSSSIDREAEQSRDATLRVYLAGYAVAFSSSHRGTEFRFLTYLGRFKMLISTLLQRQSSNRTAYNLPSPLATSPPFLSRDTYSLA